jgi:hypothetical protein
MRKLWSCLFALTTFHPSTTAGIGFNGSDFFGSNFNLVSTWLYILPSFSRSLMFIFSF